MRLIVMLAIVFLATIPPAMALRVGVYDNPPLVFKEDSGFKGFYIDILNHIAEQEGWDVEYVYGNFPSLLKMLRNGDIDLLVAVAYTEGRAKEFNYSNESVITNWGVVVTKSKLDSILDLRGLRVAGVVGDVYFESLKQLAKKFNIDCQFVGIEGDYREVFDAVNSGDADAGVVSRIYASFYARDSGLKETGIIFNPVELRFVGNDREVLQKIDRDLAILKEDPNSIYYQSLERWFGAKVEFIPEWVYRVIAVLLVLFIFAFAIDAYLSREVRKRTAEVKKSEMFLRAVFNAIQDGISVLDVNMNVLMVNHAMERWYGDVVGKKCYQAYYGRNEPCENCPTFEAIKSRELRRGVVPGSPDSDLECLEIFSYPMVENNEVKMIVEFVRDITEKKKVEEDLMKSLERYEYLWNSTNDILYIHNLEGCFVSVNRRALELLGYGVDDNVEVWDVIPESYVDFVKEKIEEICSTKGPAGPFELPVKAKDGRELWLEIVAHPVIENGDVVAVYGVARDITERKAVLEEIEKNIALISYLVDRIRNPLAAARAYCEVKEKLGEDVFDRIIENIDRVTYLIVDLDKVWENMDRLRGRLRKK
ncbi:PAS domain S-box protein [Archaeoglobus neptunius]|uniref:PAS domain S-box protein n=1 Tax=Archaeoglobus neptunius TaxID=2798580 RepID=UPI00192883C7|nr:PAS domain S-box protein [Archaeoglobus neptunius]